MRIFNDQIAALERVDLESWLTRTFPERVLDRSSAEITAYLDDRVARAKELRFATPSQFRFLLEYELAYNIPWAYPVDHSHSTIPWDGVVKLIQESNTEPNTRIKAVEQLLYGESDD